MDGPYTPHEKPPKAGACTSNKKLSSKEKGEDPLLMTQKYDGPLEDGTIKADIHPNENILNPQFSSPSKQPISWSIINNNINYNYISTPRELNSPRNQANEYEKANSIPQPVGGKMSNIVNDLITKQKLHLKEEFEKLKQQQLITQYNNNYNRDIVNSKDNIDLELDLREAISPINTSHPYHAFSGNKNNILNQGSHLQ